MNVRLLACLVFSIYIIMQEGIVWFQLGFIIIIRIIVILNLVKFVKFVNCYIYI